MAEIREAQIGITNKDEIISRKIIKPENCVMAFGIPITKEDFLKDLKNPYKDFARRFKGGWTQYYHQIVSNSDTILPEIRKYGAEIQTIASDRFRNIFKENKYDIIILFSHWQKDTIELYDKAVGITEIVQLIPYEFNGIIDLCVCHPEKLTIALRKERPNCLIRYAQNKATPFIWLYFYLFLFKQLQAKDVNYLEALELTIQKFLNKK